VSNPGFCLFRLALFCVTANLCAQNINATFEGTVSEPGMASGLPGIFGFGVESTEPVSVTAARTTANNWTVSGSNCNDLGSGATIFNLPSLDALQEFTVERGAYDALCEGSGEGRVYINCESRIQKGDSGNLQQRRED